MGLYSGSSAWIQGWPLPKGCVPRFQCGHFGVIMVVFSPVNRAYKNTTQFYAQYNLHFSFITSPNLFSLTENVQFIVPRRSSIRRWRSSANLLLVLIWRLYTQKYI